MSTPTATGPIPGVTFFSFTPEFYSRRYDLDQLLHETAARGLGPGVEIIGFQNIRGYPAITDEFAAWFRNRLEELGLKQSSLAGLVDTGRRRERPMDTGEGAAQLREQIYAAEKLGFPLMRVQTSTTPDMLEAVLPVAERCDVKLALEIHAPSTVRAPYVMAFRERFEQLGSPYLGFCPDFGASVNMLPMSLREEYRRRGVAQSVIDRVNDRWNEIHDDEELYMYAPQTPEQLREFLGDDADDPNTWEFAWRSSRLFGHMRPHMWNEIMPRILHVHGKFFDMTEDDVEPSIDYPELIRVLRDGGYTGYISSEWEGWHWNADSSGGGGFEQVARQHRLIRRVLDETS